MKMSNGFEYDEEASSSSSPLGGRSGFSRRHGGFTPAVPVADHSGTSGPAEARQGKGHAPSSASSRKGTKPPTSSGST